MRVILKTGLIIEIITKITTYYDDHNRVYFVITNKDGLGYAFYPDEIKEIVLAK